MSSDPQAGNGEAVSPPVLLTEAIRTLRLRAQALWDAFNAEPAPGAPHHACVPKWIQVIDAIIAVESAAKTHTPAVSASSVSDEELHFEIMRRRPKSPADFADGAKWARSRLAASSASVSDEGAEAFFARRDAAYAAVCASVEQHIPEYVQPNERALRYGFHRGFSIATEQARCRLAASPAIPAEVRAALVRITTQYFDATTGDLAAVQSWLASVAPTKETTDGEPQADEPCLCEFAIKQQPGKPTVHDAHCERAISQPATPSAPPTATEEGD